MFWRFHKIIIQSNRYDNWSEWIFVCCHLGRIENLQNWSQVSKTYNFFFLRNANFIKIRFAGNERSWLKLNFQWSKSLRWYALVEMEIVFLSFCQGFISFRCRYLLDQIWIHFMLQPQPQIVMVNNHHYLDIYSKLLVWMRRGFQVCQFVCKKTDCICLIWDIFLI